MKKLKTRNFVMLSIITLLLITGCIPNVYIRNEWVYLLSGPSGNYYPQIVCAQNEQLAVYYQFSIENRESKIGYDFKAIGQGGVGVGYKYYEQGEGESPSSLRFYIPLPQTSMEVLLEITLTQPRFRPATFSRTVLLPPPECEQYISSNNETDIFNTPYVPPIVEPTATEPPPPVELLAPDRTPTIINATCVGKGAGKQLMIVFEFEQDVIGEYTALIADISYELAPVTQYPDRLYYFGTPPPQGPITITLVSTSNQAVAFEETYTPIVCGPQEKKDDEGDGGYTPPDY